MIRKLRLKLVAVCMSMVTAVLAVVFLSVYIAVEQNIEDLSRQVLQQAVQEGSAGGARPEIGINLGGDRIFLPYFTVDIWAGTAYVTGGTYADLENTEMLQAILRDCLEQQQAEGIVRDYHLRYLRQNNGLYEKLAFVDMSMERAILRQMMGSYLFIALISLLLLLLVSILLSYWATRPVERAWQQQRQFLSDASHELKTPLTVILSNAELLESAVLEDRPARWADHIHSEARRMKTLVEEMLTLARADSLAPTAVFSQVSLSDITADCALAFEPVAFEAGKMLKYEIAEDIIVTGDRDKLYQLISILLDNAIKYGADECPIGLSLCRTERQAILTVSNSGEPIPPAQLPHLFQRFYRADASRGEKTGFGLGLSIAKSIADEHKSILRAESDIFSTRFICSIPLKK